MKGTITRADPSRYRGWRCIVRQERWSLTFRGWFILLSLAGGMAIVAVVNVYPFLALTRPVASDCLVVEGWIPNYALDQAVDEFHRGGYRLLLTTGSIANDGWKDVPKYTSADWAAARLKDRGLVQAVVAIPNRDQHGDRTYHSALAVRRWIDDHGAAIGAVNVVTLGTHARRTRLLFQKALGPGVKVGIISYPDRRYGPEPWYESSDGVRDVANEVMAYFYVQFFFWPSPPALPRTSVDSANPR